MPQLGLRGKIFKFIESTQLRREQVTLGFYAFTQCTVLTRSSSPVWFLEDKNKTRPLPNEAQETDTSRDNTTKSDKLLIFLYTTLDSAYHYHLWQVEERQYSSSYIPTEVFKSPARLPTCEYLFHRLFKKPKVVWVVQCMGRKRFPSPYRGCVVYIRGSFKQYSTLWEIYDSKYGSYYAKQILDWTIYHATVPCRIVLSVAHILDECIQLKNYRLCAGILLELNRVVAVVLYFTFPIVTVSQEN